MNRKRTTATIAALGGITAIVALLSGAPAAKADELSDLRANQQLLQQRVDQLAAATGGPIASGAPVLAGAFPRSFLVPGTDTSMAITGFARLNVDYFLQGGAVGNGQNGEPNNTIGENGAILTMPVNVGGRCGVGAGAAGAAACDLMRRNHAMSTSNFNMDVRESRLRVETRTPTAWGPAGTVFEFDWAGGGKSSVLHVPDSLYPRLRLAYGTLGPWLIGQDYSTFNDLASHPTTLDFGGPVGETGTVRAPMLRYTWKLPYSGMSLAGAAEAPDTTLATPNTLVDTTSTALPIGGINPTKNNAPDLVARLDWNQPWGHVSVRGVMTDDAVSDGRFISRTYLGYGGAFSGDFKPGWFGWSKDDFLWGVSGGVGMQRYLNGSDTYDLSSNMTALPTTAAAAALIHFQQNPAWQGHLGYEHWWAPGLRSDFSGSYQRKEANSALLAGGAACVSVMNCWNWNKEIWMTHVNLIWSPVPFVDVGAEWVHGQRITNANYSGTLDTLIGQVTVKF